MLLKHFVGVWYEVSVRACLTDPVFPFSLRLIQRRIRPEAQLIRRFVRQSLGNGLSRFTTNRGLFNIRRL